MVIEESELFSRCLEFTRSLLNTKTSFSFQVSTGSGFNFDFNNQTSGQPEMKLEKKKKTPSQLKRNQERMKTFLEKKKDEPSGILEKEAKYELKVDPHTKCTFEDIYEAVETNFIGTLDEAKIGEKEPSRNFRLKKLRKAGMKDEFPNMQVFEMTVKDTEDAKNAVESWKDQFNFDDLAFKNSVYGEIKIKVREVVKVR